MMSEIYEGRAHAIATSLMATCGADCSVWWDDDSSRWRCRWRGKELSPQVDHLDLQNASETHQRIVTAWRDEIRADLMQ